MKANSNTAVASGAHGGALLSFEDIEREGGGYPKKATLEVWTSTNRHNFRALVIKVGGKPRVRRSDWESWLESRRLRGM